MGRSSVRIGSLFNREDRMGREKVEELLKIIEGPGEARIGESFFGKDVVASSVSFKTEGLKKEVCVAITSLGRSNGGLKLTGVVLDPAHLYRGFSIRAHYSPRTRRGVMHLLESYCGDHTLEEYVAFLKK